MWSTVFKPRSLRLPAVHPSRPAALLAHNRYLSEAAASQRAQRSPQEGAGSLEKTQHATAASSTASTAPRAPRAEGTIASVFASLSGEEEKPLPERFASLKRHLVNSLDAEQRLIASWKDLLDDLRRVTAKIIDKGTEIVPEVQYRDIQNGLSAAAVKEIKARGSVVIRGVIPEKEALQWLKDIQDYIKQNPQVKGFPENEKAVYELYWSKAQLRARSHPAALATQKFLLSLWSESTDASKSDLVSFSHPLSYCDRLRIRQPGDSKFTLGPHCDGGSVERWEDELYRGSYKAILQGRWRDFDPWNIGMRPEANMNMYNGPGACGVFRALQGWTSLSHTGPHQGTLQVFPAIKHSSAYMILRPFFKAIRSEKESSSQASYLAAENWTLDLSSPTFPSSPLGRSQEFSPLSHPHLHLTKTMVSMKKVAPGDCVFWYADGIHSVEASNKGNNAASVLYIPSVPLTRDNAKYVRDQRACFLEGIPPPDFPGGQGESKFTGRVGEEAILSDEGRRAMGLAPFDVDDAQNEGEKKLLQDVNSILGF